MSVPVEDAPIPGDKRGTRTGLLLDRSVCATPVNGRGLTVGQLREMIWHLPDEAVALVDGKDIAFCTPWGGVLYMDTGDHLLPPCPGCGNWGCGCPTEGQA